MVTEELKLVAAAVAHCRSGRSLNCCSTSVAARWPSNTSAPASRSSSRFPVDLPTCLAADAPHARLAFEYLAALLKGERHVACKLVLDAAAAGTPVRRQDDG